MTPHPRQSHDPSGPDRRRDIGPAVRAALIAVNAYALVYLVTAGALPGVASWVVRVELVVATGTYIGMRLGHVPWRWWPLLVPVGILTLALVVELVT